MNLGFTFLWRKTWKNPVLQEKGKRFSRFEAWLYLVNILAQGTDRNDMNRGEFEASERHLARIWKWGKTSVRRFMSDLIGNRMISRVDRKADRKADHKADRFIVCNYDRYNKARTPERTTKRTAERTNINKEEISKKEREIKTSQAAGAAAVDPSPSSEAVRLSELLRRCIQGRDENAKAAKLPVPPRWARDIDKLLHIDGRRVEDIEAVIVWCQKDGCFWAPNILSSQSLRKKFDTIWGQMKRETKGEKRKDIVGQYERQTTKAAEYCCDYCENTGRILVAFTKANGKPGKQIGQAPWSKEREELWDGQLKLFRCKCEAGIEYPDLETWAPEDLQNG